MTLADQIRALPKVEIHLHLEGAIPLQALWELVKKYDGTAEVRDITALEEADEPTKTRLHDELVAGSWCLH